MQEYGQEITTYKRVRLGNVMEVKGDMLFVNSNTGEITVEWETASEWLKNGEIVYGSSFMIRTSALQAFDADGSFVTKSGAYYKKVRQGLWASLLAKFKKIAK